MIWACKKLLTVKPYQEIFVIDISNQAHIFRRTFYRNFKSKDDVINQYVISLLRKYTDWILQVNPQTYKEVIDDFFTYWPAHSAKLALLVKAGLSYKILDNANQTTPVFFRRFHLRHPSVAWHVNVTNDTKVEYMTRIAVGIFWNTFCLWLAQPTSITIQNLAILVKHDSKQLGNH